MSTQQANQPLPEGSKLENYRILRVLSSGGFSFVYLAHDEHETPVAIKEYLPASLALRTGTDAAPAVPEANQAIFRYGMKCFFDEGRALATLSHPNVVRVMNFFRANETVYMVMRYERGRTLQEHIHARRGTLRETWIRRMFTQLLHGLREVHASKLLHLDIKPGNIYVRNDGSPLLIDFGAARQTLTAEGTKLPPMYTPGFASPEHYANREPRAVERHVFCRGLDVRVPVRRSAAARQRAARERQSRAGAQGLERQVLQPAARYDRLVHAS